MNSDNHFGVVDVYLDEPEITLTDSPEERKSLEIYTNGVNDAGEGGSQTISSDDLMNICSKDFMLLSGAYGENVTPELPVATTREAEIGVIVKQESEVVTLDDYAEQHESSQRNVSYNNMPISCSKPVQYQKPPLRDSSNKRNYLGNSSKVNGEMRSYTQIIIESSEVASKNPGTHLLRGRHDAYRMRKYKQRSLQSTCKSNALKVEELAEIPGISSVPELRARCPPQLQRGRSLLPIPSIPHPVSFATPPAPDVVHISQNLVHREGTFFYATTNCHTCFNKVEHKLYRPGNWPPNHCSRCGSKWTISEWKQHVIEEDDDDVVIVGEYASPVPRKSRVLNPAYINPRVKVEPVDERFALPSCNLCGGHHGAINGRLNGQNCPFYGGPSNPNYRMWN